jgi:hypothetical protein
MTLEMGGEKDASKLLEYEWRLEKLFHERLELSGICQYRAGRLPPEMIRQSLLVPPSIFISERLSLPNFHYMHPESFMPGDTRSQNLIPLSPGSAARKLLGKRQHERSRGIQQIDTLPWTRRPQFKRQVFARALARALVFEQYH